MLKTPTLWKHISNYVLDYYKNKWSVSGKDWSWVQKSGFDSWLCHAPAPRIWVKSLYLSKHWHLHTCTADSVGKCSAARETIHKWEACLSQICISAALQSHRCRKVSGIVQGKKWYINFLRIQRFSENPCWVSKSWQILFLPRDLILKYGRYI